MSGNTIVLADPGVSRKHAGIRRDEGAYELADFGSTNGVYVNGQRVPKKALAAGDVVRVGNTEAVFALNRGGPWARTRGGAGPVGIRASRDRRRSRPHRRLV